MKCEAVMIRPKTYVFHNGFRATFSKIYKLYPMLEKELEDMLIKEVEYMNGFCIKLNPYKGVSGLPDRLVILPDNKIGLVELKRPNGKEKPRPNQVEK